jgi:dihydrofolate reductase
VTPQIIYYVAASLDGYIATPDGDVAWLAPFEATGEDYGYATFYASIDAVLLGRKTYEQGLSFGDWPYPGKPCWVFTRQALEVGQPDVRVAREGLRPALAELTARGCRRAWLVGGGTLAAAFRAEGLISEYIVAVVPVILGAGIPLFAGAAPPEYLSLLESRVFRNGIVQMHYLRGGET